MSEHEVDRDTPTSPDPAPAKAHGDAFADESGSRQGRPPEPREDAPADDEPSE